MTLLEEAIRYARISAALILVRGWRRPRDDAAAAAALVGLADEDEGAPALEDARRDAAERLEESLEGSRVALLASLVGMSPLERRALVLLGVAELDARTRAMLRRLRGDLDGPLVSLALLGDLLAGNAEPWDEPPLVELMRERSPLLHPAIASPGSGSAAHRGLVPTARVVAALAGTVPKSPPTGRSAAQGTLDMNQVARIAAALTLPDAAVVVLGPAGTGRRTLVEAALEARQTAPRHFELGAPSDWGATESLHSALTGAGIDARLADEVLVVHHRFEDTEAARSRRSVHTADAALAEHKAPYVLVTDGEHVPLPLDGRTVVRVRVTAPPDEARTRIWTQVLGGAAVVPGAIDEAAAFRIGPALILRAGRAARAAGDSAPLSALDLSRAITGELDADLGSLGKRVLNPQTWNDVVLPKDDHERVRELVERIRRRRQVFIDWGFGKKLGGQPGFVGLFSGEPGTGKTMVATLIAKELGLDLFRVDLAQIVSKWIGETEKNLGKVFDAAESTHAVLLFDEADSLFGKRTEVKSSVDRYANLEVNYLLQRLDEFHGIAFLTTNRGDSLDPALDRRIGFKLRFPFPDEELRADLWQRMLPPEAPVDDHLDFEKLAERRLSGGYIKNCVIRAAFLACAHEKPIGMEHLRRAIELEMEDAGRLGG